MLGTYGIFFPPEPIVVFWDGMEKSDLDEKYQQRMFNIQYEDLMMLRFYNTKSSMLNNLLKVDKALCFI